MPAVNRYRIAGLFVIVGKDRRELLQHHVAREIFPTGSRTTISDTASNNRRPRRDSPTARHKRSIFGMAVHQRSRHSRLIPFRFLKHRKLVAAHALVFVHASLDVPAHKIAAITARKSSRPKSSDRRPLPVAVVHVFWLQPGFFLSGIFQRSAQRPLPGGFRNIVVRSKFGAPLRVSEGSPVQHFSCRSSWNLQGE